MDPTGSIAQPTGSQGQPVVLDATDNSFTGTDGPDTVSAGDGNDTLFGGLSGDHLFGQAGNDQLFGQAGDDQLFGGTGNDLLGDGTAGDTLSGGDGDDTIQVSGTLTGQVDGGADSDTLLLADGANISAADVTGVEVLRLDGGASVTMTEAQHDAFSSVAAAAGNDVITISAASNGFQTFSAIESYILGVANACTVTGAAQNITGSDGNDTITFQGLTYTGTLSGGAGTDVIQMTNGSDLSGATISGVENLTLAGSASVSMTVAQLAGFTGTIAASGSETFTLSGDGNFSTVNNIENYVVGDSTTDSRTVTITNAGHSVTATSDSDAITFDAGTLALTGTLTGEGTVDDTLLIGNTADISGATISAIENLTLSGSGASVTMTAAQLAGFTGTVTADGANTVTLTSTGSVVGASLGAIETIATAAGGTQTITLAASQASGKTLTATDTGSDGFVVTGSSGAQTITGSAGADTIDGGAGADSIVASDGEDVLIGGDGSDTFSGSAENFNGDTISGLARGDTIVVTGVDLTPLNGSAFGATIDLGDGNTLNLAGAVSGTMVVTNNGRDSTITYAPVPTAGNDTLTGTTGNDTVDLLAGDDLYTGLAGDDVISGNAGADTVSAGDGNDLVYGGAGGDELHGGAGADTLFGGDGADHLSGGTGVDVLHGGAGSDTFYGAAAAYNGDTISGLAAGDSIRVDGVDLSSLNGTAFGSTIDLGDDNTLNLASFAAGTIRVEVSGGNSTISYSPTPTTGDDNFAGTANADSIDMLAGNDTYSGLAGDDTIFGNAGNDLLSGGAGADSIRGGDGADTLVGGGGNDLLLGGAGRDRFAGSVLELDGDTIADLAAGETLRLTGVTGLTAANVRFANASTLHVDTNATSFEAPEISLAVGNNAGGTLIVDSVATVGGDTLITFASRPAPTPGGGGGGTGTIVVTPATPTITVGGNGTVTASSTITNNGSAAGSAAIVQNTGNNNNIVTATLPSATTIISEGPTTAQSTTDALTTLVSSVETRQSSANSFLVTGAQTFLNRLAQTTTLDVRTIVPTTTQTSLSEPIVITGTTAADGATQSEAFVIDMRSLPSGSSLQLDNIEFASIMGQTTITGGAGSNYVTADDNSQFISLGADDDTLFGGAGVDTVTSAGGADIIYGNEGDDYVGGGADGDFVYGGQDQDVVYGNLSGDAVYGNMGLDTLYGGQGDDSLFGGQHADVIYGGLGDDSIDAGLGDDTISGGAGNDIFEFQDGDGNDVIADFTLGEDVILVRSDINGTGIQSGTDFLSRLSTDADGNAVIDLGDGNTLTPDRHHPGPGDGGYVLGDLGMGAGSGRRGLRAGPKATPEYGPSPPGAPDPSAKAPASRDAGRRREPVAAGSTPPGHPPPSFPRCRPLPATPQPSFPRRRESIFFNGVGAVSRPWRDRTEAGQFLPGTPPESSGITRSDLLISTKTDLVPGWCGPGGDAVGLDKDAWAKAVRLHQSEEG